MAGRKRKYSTAAQLEQAVNGYFASISYEEPAVVATPTGEVDERGGVKWKTVLLREKDGRPGMAGTGAPVTVTKWLKAPNLAGLCLRLGISKETWSNYGQDEKLGPVVERARARMEDYWCSRLDGKGANGAKFALSSHYGWTERRVMGLDKPTRNAMAGGQIPLEEKEEILKRIALDFGREDGDDG